MTDTTTNNPNAKSDPVGEAREAAQTVSDEVRKRAEGMADTVAAEAGKQAEKARGAAAQEVNSVASALRTAADEMRSGSPQERTMSQIANGLADASDAIRDKDLGEMVGAINGFARRNPLVFLGGAALVGFAATRFAKSSTTGADAGTAGGAQTYGSDYTAHARPAAPVTRTPTPGTTSFSGASGAQTPAATPSTTKSTGSKV
eukprot:TRINITY_DN39615_c0_g1_i1.p1 TRINITY_DN39615_c0_g1~~TRINITY_DN39615_c0_g1_i1.p1  ORF type:complete len:203 (-),score=42.91 TRINITY_DN39615_c0_g1_i1:182-790(-)